MIHTCHAPGCDVEVPPRMLMCRYHWFRVSRATRAWVWREYKKQEHDAIGRCTDPTDEYLTAAWYAQQEAVG